MADIAELALVLRSKGATQAKRDLDAVERSAKGAARGADAAERELKQLGRTSQRLGQQLGPASAGLAKMAAGFSALALAGAAVKTIVSFEQRMSAVAAVTGVANTALEGNAEKFRQLQQSAQRAGATTKFSASEAAEAQLFLARAGLNADEVLGSLNATLQLAAAGGLELGRAADISSNVMSQFSLAASDLEGVVNVLAFVANNANTNVEQLGEAFTYAGPIMAGFGQSVESTGAALGILGNAGIQASMAGTNLRGIMLRLAVPVGAAKKAFEDMGIALADIDPTKYKIEEIFEQFAEAQDRIGDDEFAKLAGIAFGRLNASAAIALTNASDEMSRLGEETQKVDEYARDMADAMADNVAGSLKQLQSSLQAVAIATGEGGLRGALREIVDTATEVVRIFGGLENNGKKFSDTAKRLVAILRGVASYFAIIVAYKLVAFFVSTARAIWGMVMALRAARFAIASTGFGALAVLLGTVVGATIALTDATGDMADAQNAARASTEEASQALGRARERTESYATALQRVVDAERQRDEIAAAGARRTQASTIRGFIDNIRTAGEVTPSDLRNLLPEQLFESLFGAGGDFAFAADAERQLAARRRSGLGGLGPGSVSLGPSFSTIGGAPRRTAPSTGGGIFGPLPDPLPDPRAPRRSASAVLAGFETPGVLGLSVTAAPPTDEALEALQKLNVSAIVDALEAQAKALEEQATEGVRAAAESENAKNAMKEFLEKQRKDIEELGSAWREWVEDLQKQGEALAAQRTRLQDLRADNAARRAAIESGDVSGLADQLSLAAAGRDVSRRLQGAGVSESIARDRAAQYVEEKRAAAELTQQIDELKRAEAEREAAARQAAEERERVARAMAEEREALKAAVEEAEFEVSLLGQSNDERARAVALREANALAAGQESAAITSLRERYVAARVAVAGFTQASDEGYDSQRALQQAAVDATTALTRTFEDLVLQTRDFGSALKELYGTLVRIFAQAFVTGPLTEGLTGAFGFGGANANGNAFLGGRIMPFARGGVVSGPTLFPMADGAGLMGEAGPEAVMPLRRGADGRLGVEVKGGGGTDNRTFNIKLILPNVKDARGFKQSERQIASDLRNVARGI